MIVLWRVTEQCNYACGFCAYDRRVDRSRRQVDAGEAERFGRLLAAYGHATGWPVLLSWLGGEPLLWRPVFALSRSLREVGGVAISATTNGSTLHLPAVRREIAASFAELTVSVDGFAARHDALRGMRGAWARMRDGVRALAAAPGLKLRANVVLMHTNLADFPALCEELASWGICEITYNQLGGRDRPEFFPAHALRPADAVTLAALMPPLRARLARHDVLLCGDEVYVERIAASADRRVLAGTGCNPGSSFLFVDEAGRIAPCSFSVDDYGVDIADLRTIDDLHALPARFAAAHAAARCGVCADCPSTHVFNKFAA